MVMRLDLSPASCDAVEEVFSWKIIICALELFFLRPETIQKRGPHSWLKSCLRASSKRPFTSTKTLKSLVPKESAGKHATRQAREKSRAVKWRSIRLFSDWRGKKCASTLIGLKTGTFHDVYGTISGKKRRAKGTEVEKEQNYLLS